MATAVTYTLLRRLSPLKPTAALGALVFTFVNALGASIKSFLTAFPSGELFAKAFGVSRIPWFFMSLRGAMAQRAVVLFRPLMLKHRWPMVAMYAASLLLDFHTRGLPLGNQYWLYLVLVMGATVLTLAHLRPGIADRLLRRNDVSYGVYIRRMPLVNLLSYLSFASPPVSFAIALAETAAFATLSWRFVEHPLLRRKRGALRSVVSAPAGN